MSSRDHHNIEAIALALGGKIVSKLEKNQDSIDQIAAPPKSEFKTWADFAKRFKRKFQLQTWQRDGAKEIGLIEPSTVEGE